MTSEWKDVDLALKGFESLEKYLPTICKDKLKARSGEVHNLLSEGRHKETVFSDTKNETLRTHPRVSDRNENSALHFDDQRAWWKESSVEQPQGEQAAIDTSDVWEKIGLLRSVFAAGEKASIAEQLKPHNARSYAAARSLMPSEWQLVFNLTALLYEKQPGISTSPRHVYEALLPWPPAPQLPTPQVLTHFTRVGP
ncbi:hypothetical protein CYMTET_44400 [Cymbomonas tetramitiformis]|uniref:Uncharacterized protein n=1 Tax=Cymbomonas tetramitiformis TaxID=36881 RepID=A0AAE0EZC7_9CHLO|nr:hypothetical protein CYMTET_44400 [Cymbomonas tetramitiformis]